MLTNTSAPIALLSALLIALPGCGAGGDGSWPLDGDARRLSSTFGPRLQAGRGMVYDFHRGIDIAAEEGTDLYALAAGVVKRAGEDPGFQDPVVQIEHCEGGDCWYSTYMHLSDACVDVGDEVEVGEVIGLSGIGDSGYPHLHIEIRDGQANQEFAVHPLRRIQLPEGPAPSIAILSVDDADPAAAAVEVEVRMSGEDPSLWQVELATQDRATSAALETRLVDFEEWTRKYTSSDDPDLIDTPELEGILLDPAPFSGDTEEYVLRVRFNGLTAAGQPGDLGVTATARDLRGRSAEITGP